MGSPRETVRLYPEMLGKISKCYIPFETNKWLLLIV